SAEGERPKHTAPAPELTACGEPASRALRIGEHGDGRAPTGVQDVLLERAELLGGRSGEMFSTCGRPNSGCLVYGLEQGAVDSVGPVKDAAPDFEDEPADDEVSSGRALLSQRWKYTFRCVWSEDQDGPEEGDK